LIISFFDLAHVGWWWALCSNSNSTFLRSVLWNPHCHRRAQSDATVGKHFRAGFPPPGQALSGRLFRASANLILRTHPRLTANVTAAEVAALSGYCRQQAVGGCFFFILYCIRHGWNLIYRCA
jgi:hypothetical protein